MAEDTTDNTETTTESETTTVEPTQTEERPHPLAEGGVRFEEVVSQRNQERAARMAAEAEVARLREQTAKPAPAAPTVFSYEQLHNAVQAGQISQGQMAAQLSYQSAQQAKAELRAELAEEHDKRTAAEKVDQYILRIPAVTRDGSPERVRVSSEATRLALRMKLPLSDPRVQELACELAFGSLDRVAAARRATEFDRAHADTHAETTGGGGSSGATPDPLKGIPQPYLDHWKRLGYSREQMVAEAALIPARKRTA